MATSDGRSDSDVPQIQLPEIQQQGAEGSPSHLGGKKKVHDSSEQKDTAVFRPEYCPQAVIDYYKCGKDGKYKQNTSCRDIKQVRSKARMHLSAEGWKLWYVRKGTKLELRYGLPNGGGFNSLWAACKAWTENVGIDKSSGISSRGDELVSKKFDGPISEKCKNCVNSVTPRLEIQRNAQLLHGQSCNGTSWSFGSLLSSELGSGEVRLTGVRKCRKRRNYSSFAVASQLLPHERNAHLLSWSPIVENVKPDGLSSLCDETVKHSRDSSSASRKRKKQKSSGARITRGDKSDSRYLTHVLRSSKRAPRAVVPCSSHHTVRSVLSWLIDNDVVLPRQKVCYMQGKDRHVVAEGRITREGIKCKCCKKVYSLTGFEVHAGSSNHRPSAHIFLQDGRSLFQCQMQVVRDGKLKGLRSDPDARMKRDRSRWRSDNICSICRYGGKLVLCDHCPASFHLSCIDLKDVPEGKWSCPTCRCGICGKSDFNGDSEQFTAKTILYCDQCEREYHVGCLRKRGMVGLETCPEGNWFCSNKCSKIFMRIQKLIGKSKQTGVAGLTWTLLRPRKDVSCDLNTLDGEAMTEYHSKLSVALGVLHECFIPITEPRTKRDLITDVIFNQGSELKRLNFRGFYTMLLERGDELISVATVRIFGAKVAEMPLIATRVQYRQQGMCRLLMNELEKMLSDLGVERLFLPATPQMLPKWVTSFGFTKMTVPERLKFLEYTFLEFQGTVMCQKVLMPSTIKAAESRSRGKKDKFQDELSKSKNEMGCDRHMVISEVSQTVVPIATLPSISEVIQTVVPIATLPSMDVQEHPLHGEASIGEEIMGHSSLSRNDGLSTEVLIEDAKLPKQSEMVKQISIDVSVDEGRGKPGIVETVPTSNLAKRRTDHKFKFFGVCYVRKRKMVTIAKCTIKGFNARKHNRSCINHFPKYYKRRRILASERSSIQSDGSMNIL